MSQRQSTRDFAAMPPSRAGGDTVPAIKEGDPIDYSHVAAAAKEHFRRQFFSVFFPGIVTMEEIETADRLHDELKRELTGPATMEDIRDQLKKLNDIGDGQSVQFAWFRTQIEKTSTELKAELKELKELAQEHHNGHEASIQQCSQSVEAVRVTLLGMASSIQALNTNNA